MVRQLAQLVRRVADRSVEKRRPEESLRQEVGKSPVWRGCMGIVTDGETEMTFDGLVRQIETVFTATQELDDAQRQIAKPRRINFAAPCQEGIERCCGRLSR